MVPDRLASPWARYMPLLLFAAVYLATCVVGAIFLLVDYRPFVELYEYYTGTRAPRPRGEALVPDVALLVAAPALMAAGYACAVEIHRSGVARVSDLRRRQLETPPWLPPLAFAVIAARAAIDLHHGGSLTNVAAWFDQKQWVSARAQVFQQVSFAGFVNLYLLLPLSAAWCLLVPSPSGGRIQRIAAQAIPVATTGIFSALLFQKKAPLVALLLIFMAWLLASDWTRRWGRRPLLLGAVATVIAYFALVLIPIYTTANKGAAPVETKIARYVPSIALYTLLAPLTRTSAPALYYPIVYPHQHDFYGLDLGQDILGIGVAPDDNIVVWRHMNPSIAGTVAAPFQFPLYSQVGLSGALVGSLVLGVLLGLSWRVARSQYWPREWSALLGALILMLGVYFAIDSARNDVVVSYGIVWGVLFVVAAALSVRLLNAYVLPERPGGTPAAAPVPRLRRTGVSRWRA